jgi:hypothetical protein
VSSQFHLATRVVAVDVNLGGKRHVRGDVFIHRLTASHGGEENVGDLMNDDAVFLPVRLRSPEKGTVLVAKAHVHYVTVPPLGRDARVAMEREAAARLEVSVELEDDEVLRGVIFAELPQDRRRTLDFLNAAGNTFFVLVQEDNDCLVNRARVQLVRDVGAADLPERPRERVGQGTKTRKKSAAARRAR